MTLTILLSTIAMATIVYFNRKPELKPIPIKAEYREEPPRNHSQW